MKTLAALLFLLLTNCEGCHDYRCKRFRPEQGPCWKECVLAAASAEAGYDDGNALRCAAQLGCGQWVDTCEDAP